MNWQYDYTGAGQWLNAYMQRIEQEAVSMSSLRSLDLSVCHVTRFSEPPCFRLVTGEGGDMEEVTCRVPGIVCSKVLPPVMGPLRSTQFNHVKFLRQHVRLTGLGSESFYENKTQLDHVSAMFNNAIGSNLLDGPVPSQYEGEFAMDMHTRYLTERRLVPSLRHIPFTADVDPQHVLEEARDIHFIRTLDNIVEYRIRREGEEGTPYFEPLEPGVFKEGDLVEASVTFMAFPLGREGGGGDAGHKLVMTLRGLTLINPDFREGEQQGPGPRETSATNVSSTSAHTKQLEEKVSSLSIGPYLGVAVKR